MSSDHTSKTEESSIHRIQPGDESDVVVLNVGGRSFKTTINTLVTNSTYFKELFSKAFDRSQPIVIDRNGELFNAILDYLRNGSLPVAADQVLWVNLLNEATFYGIEPLITKLGVSNSNQKPIDRFKISVQLLTLARLTFEVTGSTTVLEIKEKIQSARRTPIEQQRIIFNGLQLEDGQTLTSYGVKVSSLLHMVDTIRGD